MRSHFFYNKTYILDLFKERFEEKYNMDTRILGKDLVVSAIGLGCMGMSHAYGTVSGRKDAETNLIGSQEFTSI